MTLVESLKICDSPVGESLYALVGFAAADSFAGPIDNEVEIKSKCLAYLQRETFIVADDLSTFISAHPFTVMCMAAAMTPRKLGASDRELLTLQFICV